jgi:hypothetical protein
VLTQKFPINGVAGEVVLVPPLFFEFGITRRSVQSRANPKSLPAFERPASSGALGLVEVLSVRSRISRTTDCQVAIASPLVS